MRHSILVPTRGRQRRVYELLDSIQSTAHDLSIIEVLFYIDSSDLATNEHEIIDKYKGMNIKCFRERDVTIQGQRYNFLLEKSSGEIVMYAADDIVFKSHYWDKYVYSIFTHYQDRILLVYPKTKNYGCKLAAHGFLSRQSTKVLGRIFTPYFRCVCDDVWLTRVYQGVGRSVCFNKINIFHNHCSFNKALIDDLYVKNKQLAGEDSVAFESHKHEIGQDSARLAKFIKAFQ